MNEILPFFFLNEPYFRRSQQPNQLKELKFTEGDLDPKTTYTPFIHLEIQRGDSIQYSSHEDLLGGYFFKQQFEDNKLTQIFI